MYEMSCLYHLNAKVDVLTQKIDNLIITPATSIDVVTPNCEICGVLGHVMVECQLLAEPTPDQVKYTKGNPYANTYNPRWRNHPNFSYKNNNALFAPNPPLAAPGKSNLEVMM